MLKFLLIKVMSFFQRQQNTMFKSNANTIVRIEDYRRLLTEDNLLLQGREYLETACDARNRKLAVSNTHSLRGKHCASHKNFFSSEETGRTPCRQWTQLQSQAIC